MKVYTTHRWFWVWDYEKEEKYLNEMSAKGMELIKASFANYSFIEGKPGEYQYKMDLLDKLPSNVESVAYNKFLEELGIEKVGSCLRWVYYKKKNDGSEFELYNDVDSKIKYLKRIMFLILGVTPVNVISFIMNVVIFYELKSQINLLVAFISFIVASLLIFASFKIGFRIRKMKKEKLIHE